MELKSLGYRTDLIFAAFDGQISDQGDYMVVRTPTNPSFYWGNFLLFNHPPLPGDDSSWRQLFTAEIGPFPQVRHQAFGWDTQTGEVGEVQPFLDAGFRLNRFVVLTACDPHPPKNLNTEVEVRPLASDSEWEAAFENQVRCREPEHEESDYRVFQARQMVRYRRMAEAGLGNWFGAFIGQELVADLGIYHRQGLGRFQSVETHPDFRRRGIAGALVQQSAGWILANHPVELLVIVADQGSPAARLYESVGFHIEEYQVGLEWFD